MSKKIIIEKEFLKIAEEIFQKAKKEKRIILNPSAIELRKMVAKEGKETKYGNFVVETRPTSRAAMFTSNSVDSQFGEEELKLLEQCQRFLSKEKLIVLDRRVGKSKRAARLIVPKKYSHLAYELHQLHLPIIKKDPEYYILVFTDKAFKSNESKSLPDKDITIRIAFWENRAVKIIRNSTYFGEIKKGIFAFEDWFSKKKGKIFLHTGCREDYLQQTDGSYKNVVSLICALSGTGKTTLSSRILARKEKEKSWLIQDDGGTLCPNGSFKGFEGGGIYVKTENVYPSQPEIYYGLLKPNTILENVFVDNDGEFDFFNLTRTSNGRAVIRREDFLHASQHISTSKISNLFLASRGPLIPGISKLNIEEAVALMAIGMSQETSSGDPTQAGKIKNVFFYDPFLAGSKAEHANKFYEIIKKIPDLNFYLLNTGGIGEGDSYRDIKVSHTLSILDSILRGGLKEKKNWKKSSFGFKVPVAIRDLDNIYFCPEKLYSKGEFEKKRKDLFKKYWKVLQSSGKGLNPEIKNAIRKFIR